MAPGMPASAVVSSTDAPTWMITSILALSRQHDRGLCPTLAEVLETATLHDTAALYKVYREAYKLAQAGTATMIYPTGTRESLDDFGARLGISAQLEALATEHGVKTDTRVWIPGSLMSYRDVISMLECIFLVNNMPGGEGHHDGHMKGRDAVKVLRNPMWAFAACGHRRGSHGPRPAGKVMPLCHATAPGRRSSADPGRRAGGFLVEVGLVGRDVSDCTGPRRAAGETGGAGTAAAPQPGAIPRRAGGECGGPVADRTGSERAGRGVGCAHQ